MIMLPKVHTAAGYNQTRKKIIQTLWPLSVTVIIQYKFLQI